MVYSHYFDATLFSTNIILKVDLVLSVCLSVCLPICLSVCLPACLSLSLSLSLSVIPTLTHGILTQKFILGVIPLVSWTSVDTFRQKKKKVFSHHPSDPTFFYPGLIFFLFFNSPGTYTHTLTQTHTHTQRHRHTNTYKLSQTRSHSPLTWLYPHTRTLSHYTTKKCMHKTSILLKVMYTNAKKLSNLKKQGV